MSLGSKYLRRRILPKIALAISALLGALIVTGLVFSPYIPKSVNIKPGEIAEETLVSPRYIEFESKQDIKETEKLRKQRSSLVAPVYSVDENINKAIKSDIVNFFTTAKLYLNAYQNQTADLATQKPPIPTEILFLGKTNISLLHSMDNKTLASLEYIVIQNTDSILSNGIRKVDKPKIRTQIRSNIHILELGAAQELFITTTILEFISPNLVYDEAKTAAQIQEEIDSIDPFTTALKEGQPIVYQGEEVTPQHIDILIALNLYGATANLTKASGIFIFTLLMFLLFERFVYFFLPKKYWEPKTYVLALCTSILVISIARILMNFTNIQMVNNLNFLIPISIVTLTISLLISNNLAMISGTITAGFIAIMYGGDFYLFLFLFLSNCTATYSAHKINRRTEIISVGNSVGIVNVVVIVALGVLNDIFDPAWFVANALIGFGSGFFSAMITLALIPYLEGLFKITTSPSLLETANLNHPLIKRLMMSAPGTYQHSLMVANLAEAAAEAIGADVVLARIGAYFHDIGKMKRPTFFAENQFSGENPHNMLSPRMSKIIIAAHTKDGVEMAIKYKLPPILQDFMLQHHGTSLVSFFYTQALATEELEDSETTKDEFRYPGPKPQFKESGIVMLADAVEATVRSLDKPSIAKIENLINRLFKDKMNDGQLNECPLTMKEIETIRHTFLNIMKGIYHTRIDYQEEVAQFIDQGRTILR
ncbi:MAG: HDIG domain-containing protein [bacterium]|nr:HDIG domain-containing protein [bacterium]